MGSRYAENNSALMLICALLVPISLFAPTIIISGIAIIAFILIKVYMLANFFSQDEFEFEHKMLLLAIIVGSFYMLSMVIVGRSILMEALGLLLALGYLVLSGILVFSTSTKIRKQERRTELKESELSTKEISEFIKKSQEEYVPVQELKKQKSLTDYDDFKKTKSEEWKTIEVNQPVKYSKFANDGYYEVPHEEEYNTEGYIELYPTQKQIMLEKKFEKTVSMPQEPKVQVVNMKDAQTNVMDDLHKLKSDIMQFDEGVRTIDEKIKMIAEKAILEGAQKKLQLLAKHERTKHQKESKEVINELKSEKHILENAQKELETLAQKHEAKPTTKTLNLNIQMNAMEQLQKELELLEKSEQTKRVKVKAPAHITAQKSAMEKLNKELREFEFNRLLKEKKELEQAEKKLESIAPKPRPKRIDLFASNTGNKYHYDRRCITLKKVNKKDILKFKNVEAARKKNLKACGLCKKK